jgi:hypothetical protein
MREASLIALLAAVSLAAGCKWVDPEKQAREPDAVPATPSKELVLPVAEAPLDRAALLLAAARAASAAAAGDEDGAEQARLAGRRFELRVRFGCPAGSETGSERTPGWTARFEEPRRVLRLRVDPDINEATPILRGAAEGAFEEATGFWLPRPWMWRAACPPPPPAPPSPAAADEGKTPPTAKSGAVNAPADRPEPTAIVYPRVGVVQGYSASDPRTHRTRQAYEVTRRLDADTRPSAQGYDLVISGRLRRLPGGTVITCRQDGPAHPPACLIAADFDRVALARGDTGEQIAEWTGTGGI